MNLGSGPKLFGADFTITDPKNRLFDQIQVRAYGWGDEPYETLHVDVKKKKLYDFNADYRDMAYFDFLPSYADPLLSSRGIALNEQSFDTRRRLGSFSLDLLPGNWIVPYFAYDRDSGSGTGATTFVSDANEFPVPNTMSDRTNLYRGGVRIELKRFHVTLEEGGTTFREQSERLPDSRLNELRQFHSAVFRPDHRSDQPAGVLRNSRLQHLQQGSVYGQRNALARSLRPVSLQPAEDQRQLSAE